jgi:hypothetical protein
VSRGVRRQLELGTRGGEWRGGGILGHGAARDKNAACTWDSRWWAVTNSTDTRWHAVTVATMASPHMRGCALAGTRGHGSSWAGGKQALPLKLFPKFQN